MAGYTSASVSKLLYARSVGAIAGGDEGAKHTLSEAEKQSELIALQAQLTERLKRETRTQIPEGLITFPDLQLISVDPGSVMLKGSGVKFPVSIKGSMVSYLISQDALETAIAERTIHSNTYATTSIPTLSDLTVEPISALPTNGVTVPDTITISLSGSGTLIAKVPIQTVKERLVGVSRSAFPASLEGIAEIDSAHFTLLPFWAPFFPTQVSNIEVTVE